MTTSNCFQESSCETQNTKTVEPDSDLNFIPLIAQKFSDILGDAVHGVSKVVLKSSISRFLELLWQKVDLLVEECLIAEIFLQRFVSNQTEKRMQILSSLNSGMILIVVFVLAMKICRDDIHKNSYFANLFGVSIESLNKSEFGFLKMVNYQLWVDTECFSLLFDDISSQGNVQVLI
ncbi:MAG: hypothetical protein EZS28_014351 [Streblomastix strix]|uniref:Cyclin N-terminal domain-containing protein n=1 Tax=Streblomastix strix TaxID=222440 RepID=A0A5J4W5Z5_9EUKA|nr:MAG: hypothetical protein EZS28_014351 [Streblomastix strix]